MIPNDGTAHINTIYNLHDISNNHLSVSGGCFAVASTSRGLSNICGLVQSLGAVCGTR